MNKATNSKPAKKAAGSLEEKLAMLTKRANLGCAVASRELQRFLNLHPELLFDNPDLSAAAEGAWIDRIAGSDALRREALRREIQAFKSNLLDEQATSLSRLLVDHLAVCRLAEHQATVSAAQPVTTAEEYEARCRHSEACQRQFLEAARCIALIGQQPDD